ncbi:unnamed protein product [Amoebophrya sp. A120]|nr:unnamed protein product [Amoebophrya sp. A120]|eukprot:GSA120T00004972001.1
MRSLTFVQQSQLVEPGALKGLQRGSPASVKQKLAELEAHDMLVHDMVREYGLEPTYALLIRTNDIRTFQANSRRKLSVSPGAGMDTASSGFVSRKRDGDYEALAGGPSSPERGTAPLLQSYVPRKQVRTTRDRLGNIGDSDAAHYNRRLNAASANALPGAESRSRSSYFSPPARLGGSPLRARSSAPYREDQTLPTTSLLSRAFLGPSSGTNFAQKYLGPRAGESSSSSSADDFDDYVPLEFHKSQFHQQSRPGRALQSLRGTSVPSRPLAYGGRYFPSVRGVLTGSSSPVYYGSSGSRIRSNSNYFQRPKLELATADLVFGSRSASPFRFGAEAYSPFPSPSSKERYDRSRAEDEAYLQSLQRRISKEPESYFPRPKPFAFVTSGSKDALGTTMAISSTPIAPKVSAVINRQKSLRERALSRSLEVEEEKEELPSLSRVGTKSKIPLKAAEGEQAEVPTPRKRAFFAGVSTNSNGLGSEEELPGMSQFMKLMRDETKQMQKGLESQIFHIDDALEVTNERDAEIEPEHQAVFDLGASTDDSERFILGESTGSLEVLLQVEREEQVGHQGGHAAGAVETDHQEHPRDEPQGRGTELENHVQWRSESRGPLQKIPFLFNTYEQNSAPNSRAGSPGAGRLAQAPVWMQTVQMWCNLRNAEIRKRGSIGFLLTTTTTEGYCSALARGQGLRLVSPPAALATEKVLVGIGEANLNQNCVRILFAAGKEMGKATQSMAALGDHVFATQAAAQRVLGAHGIVWRGLSPDEKRQLPEKESFGDRERQISKAEGIAGGQNNSKAESNVQELPITRSLVEIEDKEQLTALLDSYAPNRNPPSGQDLLNRFLETVGPPKGISSKEGTPPDAGDGSQQEIGTQKREDSTLQSAPFPLMQSYSPLTLAECERVLLRVCEKTRTPLQGLLPRDLRVSYLGKTLRANLLTRNFTPALRTAIDGVAFINKGGRAGTVSSKTASEQINRTGVDQMLGPADATGQSKDELIASDFSAVTRLVRRSLIQKIEAGLDLGKTGNMEAGTTKFLHTGPTHESVVLGYLPFFLDAGSDSVHHSSQHHFAALGRNHQSALVTDSSLRTRLADATAFLRAALGASGSEDSWAGAGAAPELHELFYNSSSRNSSKASAAFPQESPAWQRRIKLLSQISELECSLSLFRGRDRFDASGELTVTAFRSRVGDWLVQAMSQHESEVNRRRDDIDLFTTSLADGDDVSQRWSASRRLLREVLASMLFFSDPAKLETTQNLYMKFRSGRQNDPEASLLRLLARARDKWLAFSKRMDALNHGGDQGLQEKSFSVLNVDSTTIPANARVGIAPQARVKTFPAFVLCGAVLRDCMLPLLQGVLLLMDEDNLAQILVHPDGTSDSVLHQMVQRLKTRCVEFESEAMWAMLGFNLTHQEKPVLSRVARNFHAVRRWFHPPDPHPAVVAVKNGGRATLHLASPGAEQDEGSPKKDPNAPAASEPVGGGAAEEPFFTLEEDRDVGAKVEKDDDVPFFDLEGDDEDDGTPGVAPVKKEKAGRRSSNGAGAFVGGKNNYTGGSKTSKTAGAAPIALSPLGLDDETAEVRELDSSRALAVAAPPGAADRLLSKSREQQTGKLQSADSNSQEGIIHPEKNNKASKVQQAPSSKASLFDKIEGRQNPKITQYKNKSSILFLYENFDADENVVGNDAFGHLLSREHPTVVTFDPEVRGYRKSLKRWINERKAFDTFVWTYADYRECWDSNRVCVLNSTGFAFLDQLTARLFGSAADDERKRKILNARKVFRRHYAQVRACLGAEFFEQHPDRRVRAAQGLIFLLELTGSEFVKLEDVD